MRKSVDLAIAYRLIGSGPVVLVSSLLKGRAGITPIAWHMPVSDDPPIVALEIWKDHFIHKAILETGDFVINIPSSNMAEMVRKLGSVSGKKIDKFEKFGLAKEPGKKVESPRLKSAIAVIECKLRREEAILKKYSVIIGDVVYAEAEKDIFTDRWHPEKNGPKPLHHLGGKIFSMPARRII
jgi:flavin reductase (DIM6/NTAB) family NADH-FMN oxidoreductase RutF